MYYFAYGSNMLIARLEKRVGNVECLGMAILENYQIAFNKQSKDGTGKTNVYFSDGGLVEGVLFELTEEQMNKLDKSEIGYKRIDLNVQLLKNTFLAVSYIAEVDAINNNLSPTKEYLQYLIDGAIENKLSDTYIEMLKSVKTT